MNDVPASVADALIDGFEHDPGRNTVVFFQQSGGAFSRVPVEATAFPHRKSSHNMFAVVSWRLDADPTAHIDYFRRYWNDVEAAKDGYYTNEAANEPQALVNDNYQANFPRLLEIKAKYDPENLFRLNANIQPA